MIPLLTSLAVVLIVATAGVPSFMVWVSATRAVDRANSALANFATWLVLLFLTLLFCLFLSDQQPGALSTGDTALHTLLTISYIAGPALAIVSFVGAMVYQNEKAKQKG